ncbi:MAG: hydantoinase/oxoprolinase family protein [Candidatus Dormiibacterota bacterium]
MRIGIDVGGTNTDAVLMDGRTVLAERKTPTTKDVTSGILAALAGLRAQRAFEPRQVRGVMIGTTHFTNAVVERRRLQQTAAIRLALPATAALPPMVDWPDELRQAIGGHAYLCHGGYEFDGREISPFDEAEVRRAAEDIAGRGIETVAISSVFSPVNADMERQAGAIVEQVIPAAHLSFSHEIGRVGLLERENATILNACLRQLAAEITQALQSAVRESEIEAPLFISQNDGTLMSVDYCRRYPVLTFASGPTNSMRGAAFLSGEADCIVADIGGTTSDVGALQHGFPREASVAVDVGGVRTNFRMPDVLAYGLGGGSLVVEGAAGIRVGPQSVGYEITERARCFGGEELTATDLAVAAGLAEIGDPARVRGLDAALVARGVAEIQHRVAELVDRVKTSATALPVVVVGGGSVLLRDELEGASRLVKPDHFSVANAIGAAIAQVGGETDKVFSLAELSREEALEQAREEATAKALAAGADAGSMQIVDVEEVPLAYLPSNAVRIRVKAVGDLQLEAEDGRDVAARP